MSGAKVPPGLLLTLYSLDHFGGDSINLSSSVDCLTQRPCSDTTISSRWHEPPPACRDGNWNDEAASMRLTYLGPGPAYRPRPSGETGARAFERGVAGPLARLSVSHKRQGLYVL